MNNSNKKLNQVVFFNLLGPIIMKGISFFTIPVFVRLLGAENYGIYTVYATYQTLFATIMGMQMNAGIGAIDLYHEGKERERCASNAMSISLVSSLIFVLFVFLFIGPISAAMELTPLIIGIMLIQCVGVNAVDFALASFTYHKKAKTNFFFSIVIALSGVLLSLLFILFWMRDSEPYVGYIWGHAIPYAVFGLAFIVFFLWKGKSLFCKKHWRFMLSLCLPVVFHALSNIVLHQSDKIMLQKMTNDAAVGVYGFAVSFVNVLNIIYNALNTTWVPFYHDDIRENHMERLKRKTNNYVFLATCMAIGFIMAMPEVVKLFVQKDFWGSIDVIPILVVGIYLAFLYTFPVNFEFYYKKTKNIALGTICAALINIGLNFVFVRLFGMIGAAVATMISYGALYLFHLIMARYVIKEEYHYPYKFFYFYLAVLLVFTGVYYLIADLLWLRWVLFAIAAAAALGRIIRNKSIF
ncbi:MAG: flippase [Clostridia bacterium]|nr:flippase [Clostridia bacterium]